jgi:hypothetical protein
LRPPSQELFLPFEFKIIRSNLIVKGMSNIPNILGKAIVLGSICQPNDSRANRRCVSSDPALRPTCVPVALREPSANIYDRLVRPRIVKRSNLKRYLVHNILLSELPEMHLNLQTEQSLFKPIGPNLTGMGRLSRGLRSHAPLMQVAQYIPRNQPMNNAPHGIARQSVCVRMGRCRRINCSVGRIEVGHRPPPNLVCGIPRCIEPPQGRIGRGEKRSDRIVLHCRSMKIVHLAAINRHTHELTLCHCRSPALEATYGLHSCRQTNPRKIECQDKGSRFVKQK